MRIGRFRFAPSLASTLAFLLLLPVLLSLGVWQLNRADEKHALLALRHERAAGPAVRLTGAEVDLEMLRYRHVTARGVYDVAHQFLVDNQVVDGRVGYFVMTPLKLEAQVAVLVNRGWVPADRNRNNLPDVAIGDPEAGITGQVNNFPSVGIRLAGAEVPTAGWPAVVQVVDSDYLSALLGYRVLPYQVYLDASQPDGYLRRWTSVDAFTPERHVGYALQWFALAAVLSVIYVFYGLRR